MSACYFVEEVFDADGVVAVNHDVWCAYTCWCGAGGEAVGMFGLVYDADDPEAGELGELCDDDCGGR